MATRAVARRLVWIVWSHHARSGASASGNREPPSASAASSATLALCLEEPRHEVQRADRVQSQQGSQALAHHLRLGVANEGLEAQERNTDGTSILGQGTGRGGPCRRLGVY